MDVCLYRPDKVLNYDRAEDPQTMDVVMSKIGATPVDYPYKTECCGAGFSISRTDIVSKLSGKIIEDAEHVVLKQLLLHVRCVIQISICGGPI